MRSKLISIVVAAMVLVTTAGCGANSNDQVSDAEGAPTSDVAATDTAAADPTEPTADPGESAGMETTDTADASPAPSPDPDGPAGTIKDPFRPGVDAANLTDWDVTVGTFVPDAWPLVDAFDEFNDPPKDGNAYIMVPFTVWYRGEGTSVPWESVHVLFVDADDLSHNVPLAMIPDNFIDIPALANGESGTGNVVFEVPADAVADGFFTASYQGANRQYFAAVPEA